MSDRNTNGTFTVGNKASPGRPAKKVEAEYLRVMANVMTLERWQKVVEAAATLAERGDDKARHWLSSFLLGAGKPTLSELALLDELNLSTADLISAEAVRAGRSQVEALLAQDESSVLHTALARKRFDEAPF